MALAPASALQPTRLALTAHVAPAAAPDSGGEGVAPPAGPPSDQIPTTGADLTQLAQEQYNLDVSAAATLGFAVVSLKADAKHDVLVYQVARYKDVSDADGDTYRFGIAVEATIQVTVDNFDGGLTLPTVAANVQLGYSSASSDLAVRGYAFDPQRPVTVPPWGSFNVDSYATFQKVTDAIVAAVLFDNDNIKPVLLATTKPPVNSPDTAPPKHRFLYALGEAVHLKQD